MGLKLAARGGKRAKKAAVIALAQKIRHLAAPAMGDGRSLRTLAKREHAVLTEKASSVIKIWFTADRRVRVTAASAKNALL
jgi:hypothetical protein